MKVRTLFGLSFLVLMSAAIVVQAGLVATNSPSQPQPPPGNPLEVLIRITGAFFLVIAVLVFGAWFFKRSRLFSLYQGGPAQLKVLESRSLGYRTTVLVVGYSHHRFLVAVSPTGVSLLSSLPDASPAEAASLARPSFSEQLSALQERKA